MAAYRATRSRSTKNHRMKLHTEEVLLHRKEMRQPRKRRSTSLAAFESTCWIGAAGCLDGPRSSPAGGTHMPGLGWVHPPGWESGTIPNSAGGRT